MRILALFLGLLVATSQLQAESQDELMKRILLPNIGHSIERSQSSSSSGHRSRRNSRFIARLFRGATGPTGPTGAIRLLFLLHLLM